jgi:hypothetical protein
MRTLNCGYQCLLEWDKDCSIQGGEGGLVVGRNGTRKTAFFEAFPPAPNDTFIRGEGETLELAEKAAHDIYMRHKACPGHSLVRENEIGDAKCSLCDIKKSRALKSLHVCDSCGCDDAVINIKKEDKQVVKICTGCYYGEYTQKRIDEAVNDGLLSYGSFDLHDVEFEWQYLAGLSMGKSLYASLVNRDNGEPRFANNHELGRTIDNLLTSAQNANDKLKDTFITSIRASNIDEEQVKLMTERVIFTSSIKYNLHHDVARLVIAKSNILEQKEDSVDTLSQNAILVVNDIAKTLVGIHPIDEEKPARTSEEKRSAANDGLSSLLAAFSDKEKEDANA